MRLRELDIQLIAGVVSEWPLVSAANVAFGSSLCENALIA